MDGVEGSDELQVELKSVCLNRTLLGRLLVADYWSRNRATISLASRARLATRAMPPSPQLRSGVCSPPNTMVSLDPNDTLFTQ